MAGSQPAQRRGLERGPPADCRGGGGALDGGSAGVSVETLVEAMGPLLAALEPVHAPGLRLLVVPDVRSEGELFAESDRVGSRAVYVDWGPVIDTGLVVGDVLDEVSQALTVVVLYRDADLGPLAAWAPTSDAAQIIRALRPHSFWASHVSDLAVLPDTQVETRGDIDRVTGYVLRVRLNVRSTI